MDFRQLGHSGLTVSVVGLGTNMFGTKCDLEQTRQVVDAALEQGVTLIDTADIYGNRGGSETLLGETLKGRRDDVVLATKFGMDMGTGPEAAGVPPLHPPGRRGQPAAAADRLHRPLPDARSRPEDADRRDDRGPRRARPRRQGPVPRLVQLRRLADRRRRRGRRSTGRSTRFISAQNNYNLLERDVEAEVTPACLRFGIGMLPFFPLASGLLTGKYHRDQPAPEGTRLAGGGGDRIKPERFDLVEALEAYARRPRHQPAGGRHRRAGRPAGGGVGHRRRHPARAGDGQRPGRGVGSVGGGRGRAGQGARSALTGRATCSLQQRLDASDVDTGFEHVRHPVDLLLPEGLEGHG